MPDTFGAAPLPFDPPNGDAAGPDESVSDPLIDTTLAFFQAVINDAGAAAWQKVSPGAALVANVRTNDPEEIVFNEKDLPCLYLCRTGGDGPEWLAEDYLVSHDTLRLFWVFPPARQSFQAFRSQILNGITKALAAAVHLNRHPAWVDPGDTDPQAKTYGSVFSDRAGWIDFELGKWSSKAIRIDMANGPARTYPALQMEMRVTEWFRQDLAKFALLAGADTKTTTSDGEIVNAHTIITS